MSVSMSDNSDTTLSNCPYVCSGSLLLPQRATRYSTHQSHMLSNRMGSYRHSLRIITAHSPSRLRPSPDRPSSRAFATAHVLPYGPQGVEPL
jgi:hypothetical protein